MKFFHSLQGKLIITSVLLGIVMFIAWGIMMNNTSRLFTASNNIVSFQTPLVQSLQRAILALDSATTAVYAGLITSEFEDIEVVRRSEQNFKGAMIEYDLFTNAILYGAGSDEFQQAQGGIVYYQWQQRGYDALQIPSGTSEQIQVLKELGPYLQTFLKNANSAFTSKKKLLRFDVQEGLSPQEKNEIEENISSSLTSIGGLKENMTQKMQELVHENEKVIIQTASELKKTVALSHVMHLVVTVLGLFLIFGAFFLLKKLILMPVIKLSHITQKIMNGDMNARAQIHSHDEIGQLETNFNAMAVGLQDAQKNLEQKISERTKNMEVTKNELEGKVSELKALNDVMVNRELKMIELKEEIQKLKEEGREQKK